MAVTATRLRKRRLLELLRQSDHELSAQQLHQRLRTELPTSGLATVYRNLKLLVQAGAVRCRLLESGEAVYSPLERDEHHLVCVQCGQTKTLPHCPFGSGDSSLGALMLEGFQPLFHTFEVHGLCRYCQLEQGNRGG